MMMIVVKLMIVIIVMIIIMIMLPILVILAGIVTDVNGVFENAYDPREWLKWY